MEDSSFKIDINSLNGKFPAYNRPVVVGYFSLDSRRSYCSDFSQLKYVHIPKHLNKDGSTLRVSYDLDRGRKNAIRKEDIAEKLDCLLRWILENKRTKENVPPDIVCFRGTLSLLMCTPYENQDGWILCGTRYQGTLYLCQFETEEKKLKRAELTDRDVQFMSWGYKFEQYMSSDAVNTKPDASKPVNEREEFCVMFTTKLNNRRLLFGAEMDGVLTDCEIKNLDQLRKAKFVELKTSRKIDTDRQFNNFKRFKLVKWWSQSFLVGIEELVCGFRDDRGWVQVLELFHVSGLHKKAQNNWDPNVCMNFCDKFLDFAESLVKEEDPLTVWKFEWKPKGHVNAVKIPGPSEFSFLPDWFTQQAQWQGGDVAAGTTENPCQPGTR